MSKAYRQYGWAKSLKMMPNI